MHIQEWRQPWVSALFVCALALAVATCQLWQLPAVLAGATLLLGKFSAVARRSRRRVTMHPWQQEIPPPPYVLSLL